MSEIMKIDTVRQYNDYFGVETLHLSVSVIEGWQSHYGIAGSYTTYMPSY